MVRVPIVLLPVAALLGPAGHATAAAPPPAISVTSAPDHAPLGEILTYVFALTGATAVDVVRSGAPATVLSTRRRGTTLTVRVEPDALGSLIVSVTARAHGQRSAASATTGITNANGCTIVGTPGPDVIHGTSGPDVICALGGDDRIRSGPGDDRTYAGSGDDRVDAGPGDDAILAGPGKDFVNGGAGRDVCIVDAGDHSVNCP
jgi:Ca2+-binding RTX toxin-like protein